MSTKAIRTALDEAIERDESYQEDCERAGRRDEARSVEHRLGRLCKALAEVEAIEKDLEETRRARDAAVAKVLELRGRLNGPPEVESKESP